MFKFIFPFPYCQYMTSWWEKCDISYLDNFISMSDQFWTHSWVIGEGLGNCPNWCQLEWYSLISGVYPPIMPPSITGADTGDKLTSHSSIGGTARGDEHSYAPARPLPRDLYSRVYSWWTDVLYWSQLFMSFGPVKILFWVTTQNVDVNTVCCVQHCELC